MKVAENTVVSLSYILRDSTDKGEIIEQTSDEQPLVFIYGAGYMLPKFEEHVGKLSTNDDFAFPLIAADAYGDVNPNAIVPLKKEVFAGAEDMLFVGNELPMQDHEGNPMQGIVKAIEDETVTVDFNHPMSGKDLHFTGKILDVRAATEEELAHGHVHGPGGVEH